MRDMQDEMRAEENDHLADAPSDHDMLQQRDDILHHMNSETERIIASFESLTHSDSDELESYEHVYNSSNVFCRYPPLPPGSDIDENTDTEDGAEDFIDLIKANMNLMPFFLDNKTQSSVYEQESHGSANSSNNEPSHRMLCLETAATTTTPRALKIATTTSTPRAVEIAATTSTPRTLERAATTFTPRVVEIAATTTPPQAVEIAATPTMPQV
jgi:hypothetical protein